ncbi:MAG: VWA domain-containing protein [Solirubrobacterales bacterium]|nr:VWA domain-containing protein [Solirubrobacterales bacterium]
MHLNAHLDIDLVALESEDEVTALFELVAPPMPAAEPRAAATVQVVLDRSGSMRGDRLDAALGALSALVDRLSPADAFGLVTFDTEVEVVVPAGPLTDKAAVKQAIAGVVSGGMTNLSAGLMRGLQEARRAAGPGGATLLLLSDGRANEGIVDPDRLAGLAAGAHRERVTTSTIGIGLDYDELLLAAVAGGGQGGHAFAPDGDAAGAVVAGEVGGLLSKTVQAASLVVRPEASVESVTVWHDLPTNPISEGLMIELGDLWAGEARKLVLSFAVPAKVALGLACIATVELRYVAVPELTEHTISTELHVNVVPGDQAAGRIPDPVVREELLFQKTQEAKRRAADAMSHGDLDGARAFLDTAGAALAAAPQSAELAEESQILASLRVDADHDARLAAKRARMEHSRKNRKRGR